MSHRKKKHDLGCKEDWFIPTHSTGAFGTGPTCFLTPFLDDARLTDDIKAYLNTKNNTSWWKTTAEWEEFMMQAEVAWHAHLVEEQRRAARRNAGGILEGSDEDDSATTISGLTYSQNPRCLETSGANWTPRRRRRKRPGTSRMSRARVWNG